MKKLFFFVAIFASSLAMGAANSKVDSKVGSTEDILKTIKKLLEKHILGGFEGTREIGEAFEKSLGGIKDLLEAGEREDALLKLDELQEEYDYLRFRNPAHLGGYKRVHESHNLLDNGRFGSPVNGIINAVRGGRYDWVDEEKGSQP
jgi:hypothetical protein